MQAAGKLREWNDDLAIARRQRSEQGCPDGFGWRLQDRNGPVRAVLDRPSGRVGQRHVSERRLDGAKADGNGRDRIGDQSDRERRVDDDRDPLVDRAHAAMAPTTVSAKVERLAAVTDRGRSADSSSRGPSKNRKTPVAP